MKARTLGQAHGGPAVKLWELRNKESTEVTEVTPSAVEPEGEAAKIKAEESDVQIKTESDPKAFNMEKLIRSL